MGVIGIGLGVHKAQIIKDSGCWYGFPGGDMNGIDGSLIGWWDATDPTTLYQDVAGTIPVSAAGQKVHRIENKAISTDKLGNFVVIRSPGVSATLIPEYQEGGLNQNSHLKILANSKGYYSSKAAGAGGVTDGSVFSNATINNQAITTFTVVNTGTQTSTNVNAKPAFGSYGQTSGVEQEVLKTILSGANQNWESRTTVDNAGTTDVITNTNLNDADEALGILVTTVNQVGTGSTVRLNGQAVTPMFGTIDPQADFVMADGRITLCGNCQDDTCTAMETGFLEGTQWYEQIVFNIALNKTQIECVEDYLMRKYDIMPVWADLVGWWDFSNIGSLYQDVGAFTSPVTAHGDTVGTVRNLALGDSSGNKLGSFLRSWSTDAEFKPVFKTGGRNNKSYAQFNEVSDNTNQKRMLFAGGMDGSADFTTTGGTSATNFSDLILNNTNQTVFVVWKNDLNDYNNAQVMYTVNGHDAGGAASDSFVRFFRHYDESNTFAINTGSSPVEWINTPSIAHNDADHHFSMFKLNSGTNESFVTTDWTQEATGTTTSQVCDFDTNSQTGDGTPAVNLGGFANTTGIYNTANFSPWVGRIYEVLHYARALNPFEISVVKDYLSIKYAPGNSTFIANELVGWWDFTDNESMFQTNAGATSVTTNNDPIGWINNKANGDLNGNKMGEFLRSHDNTATYRPVFKTGGVNGHSYGEFGGGARTGLRGGFFTSGPSSDDGGVSATKFSDLVLNSNSQTIYAIVEKTSGTAQQDIIQCAGVDATGAALSVLALLKTSGGGYNMAWIDINQGTLENLDDPEVPTGLDIVKIVGAPTASMTLNGTLEDTEVMDTEIHTDFSVTSSGLATSPSVVIGNSVAADGETGTFEWIGKIYEIFVWNKTLTADEQTDMDAYLINKYGQVGNIIPVADAVGHWDFTNASNLHQNLNGTTDVTTDGDRIGHVINLAPGDENGDRLGGFLNAPADTNVRPTYKTGGLNGHSYAKFDEGGDTSCLRGGNFDGVDSIITGGIASDVFSNLQYNVTERTIFMMIKHDNLEAGTIEYLFQMHGTDPGWDIVSRRETISKFINSTTNANKLQYYRYDNSGSNFPNFTPTIWSESQISDQATLISGRNSSDPFPFGTINFFFDTVENSDDWNWYTFPTYLGLQYGTNDYNRPTVSIGAYTNEDGSSSTNAFDGDIYEVVVFNRTLTDDEMAQMNTYFQVKYALSFGTPTLPIISEHVGHWDFTDASSLKQLRNNTTAVTADGDPIGRINNLAPGDASGNKLGAFMRAGADDTTRPTYKTDGIMGKSYAKFETLQGLRTGFFTSATCDDDGGETTTKFSDLQFNQYSSTIFFVLKHDLETIASAGDHFMVMRGDDLTGGSDNAEQLYYRSPSGNDAAMMWNWSDTGSLPPIILESPDAFGSDTKLIMIKNGPGLDGAELYENGTLKDTEGTAAAVDSKKIYFDELDPTGKYQVVIGTTYFQADGTIQATAPDDWEGDIYEILIYNKVLSADEIVQVEAYITAKYGITIS